MSFGQLAGFLTGSGSFDDNDDDGMPKPFIPNSPDRSPFLRLPLEVREIIYAWSLIFKRAIIMRPEWDVVEHYQYRRGRSNAIIYVCRKINAEATAFIYKNNVFRTILRPPPVGLSYRETFSILPQYLSLLRNVILTCERDKYEIEWHQMAAASIKKLADANVNLNSLTITTFPDIEYDGEIAARLGGSPITFADFFEEGSEFMTALKSLRCQTFNVVIKKIDLRDMDPSDNTWRLLISLDLRDLHAAEIKEGGLVNPETIKTARERAEFVEEELRGLKERFEEVFEDDDNAVEQEICELMHPDETYEQLAMM